MQFIRRSVTILLFLKFLFCEFYISHEKVKKFVFVKQLLFVIVINYITFILAMVPLLSMLWKIIHPFTSDITVIHNRVRVLSEILRWALDVISKNGKTLISTVKNILDVLPASLIFLPMQFFLYSKRRRNT